MKTLLVCHHDAPLHRLGMARWLGSFSDLSGIVEIHESRDRLWRRVRREIGRVGTLRFLDVLAFRAFYLLTARSGDREWEQRELARLRAWFPGSPPAPDVVVSSPNAADAEAFIRQRQPDLVIARCKTLLAERIFSIPRLGTFVMHPGVCPEYRNAHGCFWALANDDMHNVGATLLRIDAGVDTGPVYAHFRYDYDALRESPFVIQTRVVFENLDAIRLAMLDAATGRSQPLDTSRRPSAAWGQPWLTRYLRWKQRARKRHRESAVAALS